MQEYPPGQGLLTRGDERRGTACGGGFVDRRGRTR